MVAAGLVFTQVDLYLQSLVTAGIIFVAVLLDSLRTARLARLARRTIRVEPARSAGRAGSDRPHRSRALGEGNDPTAG